MATNTLPQTDSGNQAEHTESNQTNNTLQIIKNDLTTLAVLVDGICDFGNILETKNGKNKVETDLEKVLANLVKLMVPDASDEEANELTNAYVITLASRKAAQMAFTLEAAINVMLPPPKGHAKADEILSYLKDEETTFSARDRDEFMGIIPWFLSAAVAYIGSDGIYEKEPTSDSAIGLRMLCVLLDRMERIGCNFDEPEDIENIAA